MVEVRSQSICGSRSRVQVRGSSRRIHENEMIDLEGGKFDASGWRKKGVDRALIRGKNSEEALGSGTVLEEFHCYLLKSLES